MEGKMKSQEWLMERTDMELDRLLIRASRAAANAGYFDTALSRGYSADARQIGDEIKRRREARRNRRQ
jgi:hypothetical protein